MREGNKKTNKIQIIVKILVLTVGGSCAPIVTSIHENKPDKVFFLCSDDDRLSGNKGSYSTVVGLGKVCGNDWKNPDKLNIVAQTGLTEEKYEVIKIKYFDDHNHCYKVSLDLLNKIKKEDSQATITVDYTGGTKSMTVGLVMAAADLTDIAIAIVKGDRTNLVKVDDGTQRVSLIRINYPFLEKQKQITEYFISQFDYASAIAVLQNIFQNSYDLPKDIDDELQILFTVSKAFDAWDRFEHVKAKALLEIVRKKFWQNIKFLDGIIKGLEYINNGNSDVKNKFTGYEVVQDLVLNAERRAFQRRYDDAVGRIYRATELLAQVFLKKNYNIITADLDISLLPSNLKSNYKGKSDPESGKISLGLFEAYRLIAQLDHELLGPLFLKMEKKMLSSLSVRNASILAHGFEPVDEKSYKHVYETLILNFIKAALKEIQKEETESAIQFPKRIS